MLGRKPAGNEHTDFRLRYKTCDATPSTGPITGTRTLARTIPCANDASSANAFADPCPYTRGPIRLESRPLERVATMADHVTCRNLACFFAGLQRATKQTRLEPGL